MSEPQRYSRWFTEYPSTHIYAGQTVEVTPVSQRVTDEMVERACKAHNARILGDDLANEIVMRAALEAALAAKEER